jgi:hypothetical protein
MERIRNREGTGSRKKSACCKFDTLRKYHIFQDVIESDCSKLDSSLSDSKFAATVKICFNFDGVVQTYSTLEGEHMCKLLVESKGEGLHPSQLVVSVKTKDGNVEELLVDRSLVSNGKLEVNHPVGEDGDNVLVELPRESSSGSWRIWVPKSQLERVFA